MGEAHIAQEQDAVVITLQGEIDLATELDVSVEGQRVVVDASGVTFASSPFLAWLLRTQEQSDEMLLRRPSEAVQYLLDIAGLGDKFSFEQ